MYKQNIPKVRGRLLFVKMTVNLIASNLQIKELMSNRKSISLITLRCFELHIPFNEFYMSLGLLGVP